MVRSFVLAACACVLAGCAGDGRLSEGGGEDRLAFGVDAGVSARPTLDPATALENFREAVARAEPAAEVLCRERKVAEPGFHCDVRIMVDRRVAVQPNAFQTFDEAGRPIILFNVPFIATARNQAEIAFVLGHEMGHLLGGHLEQIRKAKGERAGSGQAALSERQRFELEADLVGARVARLAGYDPVLGARVLAHHGGAGEATANRTHPDSAQRIAAVAAASGLGGTGRSVE